MLRLQQKLVQKQILAPRQILLAIHRRISWAVRYLWTEGI
jgi:hypothetical protein